MEDGEEEKLDQELIETFGEGESCLDNNLHSSSSSSLARRQYNQRRQFFTRPHNLIVNNNHNNNRRLCNKRENNKQVSLIRSSFIAQVQELTFKVFQHDHDDETVFLCLQELMQTKQGRTRSLDLLCCENVLNINCVNKCEEKESCKHSQRRYNFRYRTREKLNFHARSFACACCKMSLRRVP